MRSNDEDDDEPPFDEDEDGEERIQTPTKKTLRTMKTADDGESDEDDDTALKPPRQPGRQRPVCGGAGRPRARSDRYAASSEVANVDVAPLLLEILGYESPVAMLGGGLTT